MYIFKQKCSDARHIVVELGAVKSLLSSAVDHWTNFGELYTSLFKWLIEAESKTEENADFFSVAAIKDTKDAIDRLNVSSHFLSWVFSIF